MSRSIWMQCAGSSERSLTLDAWRVVESQYVVSTRKLVDSDEEQRLLEELIDGVKPPTPEGPEFRGLHYLLFTPFRHPPLRYGSRSGTTSERGIWYGSESRHTAFAEVAYYRLLFFEGTATDRADCRTYSMIRSRGSSKSPGPQATRMRPPSTSTVSNGSRSKAA